MWASKGKVAVVGVGYSKFTRIPEGVLGGRTIDACINAVEDAGLKLSDIDGLASYPDPPFREAGNTDGIDAVTVNYMIQHLDVAPDIQWYAQVGAGMCPSAVIEAVNALAAGACKYALVWRGLHQPKGIYGAVSTRHATGDDQFITPYGMGASFQRHSILYRRYMDLYGARREHMAALVTSQRANANKNPNAFFYKTPMTKEDYMNARMIADPLCLFDCDIPLEGAIAMVLTTADRAKDLRNRPAYVAAYSQQTDRQPELLIYTLVDYMKSGRTISHQIWEMSGLRPKDVDVAELYDGYSPSVYYWLESAGFCKEGEGFQFAQDGRIELGGELPVNTNGGALSEGRTHGMGHLAEGVLQVSGRGGERQVANCHVAYCTAGSPMRTGAGLLLTSEP